MKTNNYSMIVVNAKIDDPVLGNLQGMQPIKTEHLNYLNKTYPNRITIIPMNEENWQEYLIDTYITIKTEVLYLRKIHKKAGIEDSASRFSFLFDFLFFFNFFIINRI